MDEDLYTIWQKSRCGGFTKPFTKPFIKPEIKLEDNKMITAEEARKIADEDHENISSIISIINYCIKTSAEDGEYETSISFDGNYSLGKYLNNVKEILKNNNYDVNFKKLNNFDDYRLSISWKK